MNNELIHRNPYPGPCPFQPHEGHIFFGREQEVSDLLALVIAHRAVLLYAQSGAGKTSILNAKLIPALLQEGFEVFPIARVHRVEPEETDWKGIGNIYVLNTLLSWEEAKVNVQALASLSLPDALQKRERKLDRDDSPLPRAVIFDQFEELFTSYAKRWGDREPFFRQVNEALEQDRLLRVLFVIREDYLAELDPYTGLLPEELQTRYRLECLRREAACRAIAEPAKRAGRPFHEDAASKEDVASELVERLLNIRVKDTSGETVEAPGEYVEPVQLQVVCRSLWDSLPPGVTEITAKHLKDFGDVQEALKGFYEGAIREAMKKTGVQENDLRAWFSEKLVTPAGTRGTVFQGKNDTEGIPNAAVAELESQHIIRAEPRAGARWYELTHDQLIEPVRQSNEVWFAHQRAEEQRRQIETACQRAEEQRKRAEQQARVARRLTRLIAALVVMVVVAIIAAGFAFYQAWVAQQRTAEAKAANRNEKVQRLASQAASRLNVDPQLSLLLALEATSRSRRDDGTLWPELESILKDALHKSIQASRLRLVLRNHAGMVNGIAFSPNGRYIATASADATAKLWDATSGSDLVTFYGHTDEVSSVAFSPDGKRIATGGDDGTARVWDAESGKALRTLSGHLDSIKAVVFSPDGRRIATASTDGTARVWDGQTGRELSVLAGHFDEVTDIAFDPCGVYLATTSADRQVKVWYVSSGYEALTLYGHGAAVQTIAFNPRGTRAASGDSRGWIKVWDIASGKEVAGFRAFINAVYDLAFSPDGTQIATVGLDGAKVCNASSGQEVFRLYPSATAPGILRTIAGVAFSPDGKQIATAGWDRMARVWTTTSEEEMVTLMGHRAGLNDIVFSPDGRYVAAADDDGAVRLWGVPAGNEIPTLIGHSQRVEGLAYDPDGRLLATASVDGTARLWDIASGERIHTFSGHRGAVEDVAFSPEGTRIATASKDGTAKVWDTVSGNEIRTFRGHKDEVFGVTFSPDGKLLATASKDGTAKVWDSASGENKLTLRGHKIGLMDVGFDRDGTRIATSSKDRMVKIWDAASGVEYRTLSGHDNTVTAVAFSPDGLCVASAGTDGTARLWDVASGREVYCFSGHTGEVEAVAFSPDGKYLATAGRDGIAHIRILDAEGLASLAATRITRSLSADEIEEFHLSEDDSRKAYALVVEGRELARAGDFTNAVRVFRDATTLDSTLDLDPNAETIACLRSNGLTVLAKKFLADVDFEDPNAESVSNIGLAHRLLILARQRDRRMLIDPNDEVLRLCASILVNAARKYARSGHVNEAVVAFDKAKRLDPTLSDLDPNVDATRLASQACVTEAWNLLRDSDAKETIARLEKATSIDPKYGLPCALLGTVYRGWLKQYDKAIKWWGKAVALAPTPESYAELAYSYLLKEDYSNAVEVAAKALQSNPECSFGSLVLALAKDRTKEYEHAVNVLRNIKESDPHYAAALATSGSIYFDAFFEFEAAYEKFRKLLELESNNVSYKANFTEANLATGRFEQAYSLARGLVRTYEAAKIADADNELAMRFVMIASLILQGAHDEARDELTQFVSRYNGVVGKYKPEWSYKGTRRFIEQRAMPEDQRKLLLNLLAVLEKPQSNITIEQIAPR
jgi:WD40 repeat protein/Flp pilus assembly protein TadD